MRLALLFLLGCQSHGYDASAAPRATPSALTGRVTVGNVPVHEAEVLVVRDGKVVAAVSATPGFTVPASTVGDCKDVTLVVRLVDPLGVVTANPPAGCHGDLAIDVPKANVVELTGTIKPAPTWVDLKLTPRVNGVPPTIILAEGTSTSLREALLVKRVTGTGFRLRVVAGSYWLSADHTVDGPKTSTTENLRLDALQSSGAKPTPSFGGFELGIIAATQVELSLRPADAH